MGAGSRPVVAILGGGPYAARLCEVIAAHPGMPAVELRLHARDRDRLAVIARHAAGRVGAAHAVRADAELDAAVAGAAAVILLVRVGGLAARDHDERFPTRFGLVGDEGVGVGGLANAWRTLPVLDAIAARIAAGAPGAAVLDLMAPLGITTRLLVERGHRAVGLCELPAVTRARWEATAGPAARDAPPLAYAGLNHLGFFWSPGRRAADHPVVRAAIERREVTIAVVERFDAAPLHYFVDVFEPATARALGRPGKVGRAGELAAHNAVLVEQFAAAPPGAPVVELDRRATPWFEHAVAPALHAALGGPAFAAPLDLPGGGRLDEAPDEVVVELPGRLDAAGAALDPVPPRPAAVRAVLARLAAAEDAAYRAARDRDRHGLGAALDALPIEVRRADREPLLDAMCAAVPA
jgi:alpha-galactosidase/6-phospho-beta-glucosidase family protein